MPLSDAELLKEANEWAAHHFQTPKAFLGRQEAQPGGLGEFLVRGTDIARAAGHVTHHEGLLQVRFDVVPAQASTRES